MLAYADGMFRWPDVYQSLSVVWLSGALAHAWMNVVPLPPVLAVNVLFAVLINVLAAVSFVSLRKYFDRSTLWIAILISELFIIPPLQNGYGYQALSVVLLSSSAFVLFNGLVEKRDRLVLFAGSVAGFAVLTRLPNILGIGLVATPLIYSFYKKEQLDFRASIQFVIGYAIGLLIAAFLLFVCGQLNVYVDGLSALFNNSNERYDYGTPQGLIATYSRDVLKLFLYSSLAIAFSAFSMFAIARWIKTNRVQSIQRSTWWIIIVAITMLFVVVLFVKFSPLFILKDLQRYVLGGLILVAAFAVALRFGSVHMRLLMWCGLIACAGSFAGSDVGFGAYALFPVLLPLVAFGLHDLFKENFPTWLRLTSTFWISAIATISIGLCVVYIYRDASRFELTHSVANEPKLRGVFTNESRRDAVEQLLNETHRYVKPNTTIWATPDLPMIYFLTSTKPFTNYPWDNLFNANALEQRVLKSQQHELPKAVITANGTTRNAEWPTEIIPSNEPDRAQKEKTVTEFLSRHRYEKVWSNSFFQLWLPPQN